MSIGEGVVVVLVALLCSVVGAAVRMRQDPRELLGDVFVLIVIRWIGYRLGALNALHNERVTTWAVRVYARNGLE
jgi:hypothetical protein